MDKLSAQRLLQDYADEWSFTLPAPLIYTSERKCLRTIAFRVTQVSDPNRQFAYLERGATIPSAFHFVSTDPQIEMLPLWAAYPTVSAFDINWRMGSGEDYKHQWWSWLATLDADALQEYKDRHPPPADERGWSLCFWDVDDVADN